MARRICWALLAGVLAAVPAWAGHGASVTVDPPNTPAGCEDLSAVPITFNIDYSAIQEVWLQGGCTGCHNVTQMGGLRLDVATTSILQLVGQPSFRDSAIFRVLPLNPDYSLMHQMLSCTPPASYPEMPPSMGGARIAPELRALVYDWIAQGARGFDEDSNPVSDVIFLSPFESQRFQRGLQTGSQN